MPEQKTAERQLQLAVNGETLTTNARSVRTLLAERSHGGSFFAVAVNRNVVPRERWDEPLLRDGDLVEIVTPRQGG